MIWIGNYFIEQTDMAKKGPNIPVEYKKSFQRRLRMARESVKTDYPTIADFEKAMNLNPETYKQYENRSMMPHHLIERFCELTGFSAWFILTGKADSKQPTRPVEKKTLLNHSVPGQ